MAGPAGVEDPNDQLGGSLVTEDDEAPVGLLEELEQVIDDPGQKGIHVKGFAQAVADLQDDLKFFGGLGLQGLDAAVVVNGRLDGESGLRVLVESTAEVA